jgi:hypothetical protein
MFSIQACGSKRSWSLKKMIGKLMEMIKGVLDKISPDEVGLTVFGVVFCGVLAVAVVGFTAWGIVYTITQAITGH